MSRQLPNIPNVCPVGQLAGEVDMQELAFAQLLSTRPGAGIPTMKDFCSKCHNTT